MRRVLKVSLASALVAAAASVMVLPTAASAQYPQGQQGRPGQSPGQQQQEDGSTSDRPRPPRIAPLRRSAAAGPCPYVKVLYDAARYVELTGDRVTMANVGFTGEIEGLVSDCAYQSDQPITVHTRVQFNLGRGPQAQGDGRTYRYWIAVTERNRAVLAKEYFDLPVNFDGATTATVTQDQTIVIPRAEATTSGDHFEVLVGFDVTPAMAEFNRNGNRFRANAGTGAAQPPAQ
ncbi:MAG: Tat pathway signal sequence domain protein [Brevundimonas sp.]|uniref:Tat pathway signal sequence domain protein n=1 Tax=Brevundimonas sp. TaxID=1871086 RepID=UPI00271CD429|nr:Tat pathway signal sequence domain protein [Brevundimonas sp.]MDO9076064.1 Tat pathway signal sequence domain protein [Brevundimonas sp.]MDP3079541.1 Tat pathway signal sequence domain protein [Brevundimonas sp.]MDZ4061130.1 Tat pathway signal sequence domain protein [Brevundimonas sp.]